MVEGVTDAAGRMLRIKTNAAQRIIVEIGDAE
jgi:hypothetical protein